MRITKQFFVTVFLLCLVFSACTSGLRQEERSVGGDVPDPAKPPEEFYVVGPGDVLDVALWKDPSLSGPVTVRPDGFITLPLVNEVQVAGLTTEKLRATLEQRYREYVTDAAVTVRVEKIASSEIFLIGEVEKPAAYPVAGNDTVLQLLTRAGGLTPFASRHKIRILRRAGEKVTEFIVDYDAIVEGELEQDILLRPGDRIIVP
ncbi:MAG: polysaccharide export protein [Deltaproteobacteria bacterium]|nr:polysaccharide export protein [Deltaproteobacteria bacterium]